MKGRKPNSRTPTTCGPLPECPGWLTPFAREEWGRVVQEVDLTAADFALLQVYCQTLARWREAEEQVSGNGIVMDNGRKNPAASVAAECVKQLRGLADQLGLSPAARGRLNEATSKPTATQTALDSFVGGGQ